MSTDAVKGAAALEAKDYETAIAHYTTALKTSRAPLWFIERSKAYQRSGKPELALADTENAVLAAIDRGRRDQIANGHYRRGIAYYGLKQYGNARMCFVWASKYNSKEKALPNWMAKASADYNNAGGDEAEGNQVTVLETPAKFTEATPSASKERSTLEKGKGVVREPVALNAIAANTPAAPASTPKEKIRHDWYQSPTNVTINILAKGVPKDSAQVDIQEGVLNVNFPIVASGSDFDFSIDPLFAKIDKEKSSFRVTPHKIEIVLHKAVPGKWATLEGTEPIETTTEETTKIPEAILNPVPKVETAPAYPTSSKNGPKNWDTLVDDDKEEGEGGADDFFKQLYAKADPDTRRAMMKSYQESNGTSLSTSWSEVGSKTFETSPPDGMEARKWEI